MAESRIRRDGGKRGVGFEEHLLRPCDALAHDFRPCRAFQLQGEEAVEPDARYGEMRGGRGATALPRVRLR